MDSQTQQQLDSITADIQKLQATVGTLQHPQDTPVRITQHLDNPSKDNLEQIIADRILDIVWNEYYYYSTTFDSIDRYLVSINSGSVSITSSGISITTGGTGTDEDSAFLPVSSDLLSTKKEARFRLSNKLDSTSNVNWFALTLEDSTAADYTGFRMMNGSIYGVSSHASTETDVLLQTYIAGTFYQLELRYFPGQRVDFYVNGIQLGTIIVNLPTLTPTRIVDIGLSESTASAKTSTTSYFEFIHRK